MKLLLTLTLCLASLGFGQNAEKIKKVNAKMGAIVYLPSHDVIVRKVALDGPFADADISKGDVILEVADQVVYGLNSFYNLIASQAGETNLLIEKENGDLQTVIVDLGAAIPGAGNRKVTESLAGVWYGVLDAKFELKLKSGSCADGSKKETYRYRSAYRGDIKSHGWVVRHCSSNRLRIRSEKYGFNTSGHLNSGSYMVWSKVPLFGSFYDFHMWR